MNCILDTERRYDTERRQLRNLTGRKRYYRPRLISAIRGRTNGYAFGQVEPSGRVRRRSVQSMWDDVVEAVVYLFPGKVNTSDKNRA